MRMRAAELGFDLAAAQAFVEQFGRVFYKA
jgi:hypothetical protein